MSKGKKDRFGRTAEFRAKIADRKRRKERSANMLHEMNHFSDERRAQMMRFSAERVVRNFVDACVINEIADIRESIGRPPPL